MTSPPSPVSPDDFFAELNLEIAKAKSASEKKAEMARLSKAANNRFATSSQRALSKAEYEALRAEMEATRWNSEAVFAMFSEQECDNCGSTHRTFLQFMELQYLHSMPTTKRFMRVTRPVNGLPKKVLIQPVPSHICADCAADFGFDIAAEDCRVSIKPKEGITVSSNYSAEDLNLETEQVH